jgi:hypothetical protein
MLRRSQSQERILSRERATPALLRGRRPPPGGGGNSVLVSQQEEEQESTFRQAEVRIPIQRSNEQPTVNEPEEDEIDSFSERREGRRGHEDYGGRGFVSSGYSSNTLPKKLPGSSSSNDNRDNDREDSNSGGKSGGGFKAASDRLFGRKPAADGGSSSTLPRNLPSREKQPQAATKEKEKQPLLTQMRETLAAAAAVLPRQHNAFMKETRASFRRKSLIQGEAERESSSRPAPLTRTGSLRHATGGGGGGAKEGAGLFGRSSSFRQKNARIEEDSLAGKSRAVAESGRPLAESGRPLAESGRPLTESGRPLAESSRRLGTHGGSREKIAATTQDAEGVCTAHGTL